MTATSSFSGDERDTMKLMARFGKAPLTDPKPVVMDNLPAFRLPPSPLLHVTHNVTAFHPSPIHKETKKKTNTHSITKLKPREQWFSRHRVPSSPNNGSSAPAQISFIIHDG